MPKVKKVKEVVLCNTCKKPTDGIMEWCEKCLEESRKNYNNKKRGSPYITTSF